ncbi:sugar transferase [Paenilisteria rocourtiae]|uniref:Undecaprenyl phosphate N,N'-diacetylbacillosamine 1-phosphate transferase/sugar transferase EpsL n=1 Tax=Listeria rocourtiae TaxID=647910 RepID=A0A4R6ZEG8_9LIST|nr:sugar transferase [Listeria rocourtiae]EUJ44659.1 putative glycosyltransferase [Listeria rocourtiae FSL F6-920]MBC1606007.1 sugar transferase [Listeria rocourtiae]TDR50571.1 undecaprenyl phosphate N,N'-diacetylbacillosamine 1-phosphate transferase/sugar transferase EpsL [Listeria rocourtiae]
MKRCIDVIVAFSMGIIAVLPVLGCAIIFYLLYKEAPFYVSERAGKNQKAFRIYKLKSMRQLFASSGESLPDEARLTSFGMFLRKYSLDELPQLWNVLKGDMSLIGPRPLPMEYNDLYSEEQRKRNDMKPGITGLAQVNGRNAISWEEKFAWDIYYVDHYSAKLDVKIFIKTIGKVLGSADISQDNHVTAEKFQGTIGETQVE